MKTPQPPVVQQVAPDPNLEAIKLQAAEDDKQAIQNRTTQRTNDLLLRYGARSAFSGTSAARVGI